MPLGLTRVHDEPASGPRTVHLRQRSSPGSWPLKDPLGWFHVLPDRHPHSSRLAIMTLSLKVLAVLLVSVLDVAHAGIDPVSVYPQMPDDPDAYVLTSELFGVHADGRHDDTAALQRAIDLVGADEGGGVLFVPPGTYLLSDTVYVWPGVRLLGFGPDRPVFTLAENTPGFQEGDDRYLLFFSGGRASDPSAPPRDGTPGTFYSALSNIDIDIKHGNPAAAAVRFHVAQHCFLSHMDLRLGDARAGLVDIGNLVESLRFEGGQIAIDTARSAPGWPITVLDCTFENQKVAAIRTREAGLSVVRPTIRNVPAAVVMDVDTPDQLWISDGRFENITGPAIVISRPQSARTQVSIENIACSNVPVFASLRGSDSQTTAPDQRYLVGSFTHGLHLGGAGSPRKILTRVDIQRTDVLPPAIESDVPRLPPPSTWMNVRSLGAVGDGKADDTTALRNAIATHRVLYFPPGWYNVSEPLELRSDTILIGLHPALTIINLPNDTPAFEGGGPSVPIISAPRDGTNIVSGIGVYAGERNPRAVAMKWSAGEHSMIDDVRFHGGHGTRIPGREYSRYGDRDHWNTQAASLWVTSGGGGTLKNIWTPNPHARSGLVVSDTSTPGRLYAMSAEHHVDHEVIIENAANWRFFALQFEEEREEGPKTLPLKINNCDNLLFANTFFYRVVSSFVPAPFAITVEDSTDVRFRNVHVYSNSKVSFDNSVYDADTDARVRDPEFAVLDLPSLTTPSLSASIPASRVIKLADGFHNIAGLAVGPGGDVYFADARKNDVHRWSRALQTVEHVRRVPERPEQLAFDAAGNLLVIAYEGDGTVLVFDPEVADSPVRRIAPQPAVSRPGGMAVLPVSHWASGESFMEAAAAEPSAHYVAPDGETFIPASHTFTSGATMWGVKLDPLLRTFGVARAEPGRPFYVTNEHDLRTYVFDVQQDGSLTNGRLFVEEGGECITTDLNGNVYIAAGQILVFNPSGERIGVIHVPQRPTCLVFGGSDDRMLYIAARTGLYAVPIER